MAPGEAAKRLAQFERRLWGDELCLRIGPTLGARRHQWIAQCREWQAGDQHTGWRPLALVSAIPEGTGAEQHDARLAVKRLPELACRAVYALGQRKDVVALQRAFDAKRAGS